MVTIIFTHQIVFYIVINTLYIVINTLHATLNSAFLFHYIQRCSKVCDISDGISLEQTTNQQNQSLQQVIINLQLHSNNITSVLVWVWICCNLVICHSSGTSTPLSSLPQDAIFCLPLNASFVVFVILCCSIHFVFNILC